MALAVAIEPGLETPTVTKTDALWKHALQYGRQGADAFEERVCPGHAMHALRTNAKAICGGKLQRAALQRVNC